MAGIALARLVRPGCPTVLGRSHSTVTLESGALTDFIARRKHEMPDAWY